MNLVQPEAEGEVVTLPNDVLDRAVGLTYDQFPTFFDDLAVKVQHILITKFQIALVKLQNKRRDLTLALISKEVQSICHDL